MIRVDSREENNCAFNPQIVTSKELEFSKNWKDVDGIKCIVFTIPRDESLTSVSCIQ